MPWKNSVAEQDSFAIKISPFHLQTQTFSLQSNSLSSEKCPKNFHTKWNLSQKCKYWLKKVKKKFISPIGNIYFSIITDVEMSFIDYYLNSIVLIKKKKKKEGTLTTLFNNNRIR